MHDACWARILQFPQPGKHLVPLNDGPYYHCISRCVRRAIFYDIVSVSGADLSHRRGWITERMKLRIGVFAIELC